MLRALIAGKATPQEMAELAKGLLRKKIPELELALEGKLRRADLPRDSEMHPHRRPGSSRRGEDIESPSQSTGRGCRHG